MKLFLFAGLALACGCADETPAARTPIPGSVHQNPMPARVEAHRQAIARITTAICDREQSCGTIGPGAYFGSREECQRTVSEKYTKELGAEACPDGLDQGSLDACLGSIEATECVQPGDAITRSARCPTSSICMK